MGSGATQSATRKRTGRVTRASTSLATALRRTTTATSGTEFVHELRKHVAHEIGPIAKPRQILVVPELPKTRSGKIMRRLLRDVAENRDMGDVTTLADPSVMRQIAQDMDAFSED